MQDETDAQTIRAGGSRARILILGGTAEARMLAARLVAEGDHVITSLAGRTAEPLATAGELRIGGFGGAEGLAAYLRAEGITRLIDATHPYAVRISDNARIAAAAAGIALEQVVRPGWAPCEGDRWIVVCSLEAAAATLPAAACAFLALGRQYISAFAARRDCHFVLRMVDPPATAPDFASFDLIVGKPSADAADEAALFRQHRITHLVCRNSGGEAGYGKIAAARLLELPVVMIGR